MPTKPLNPHTTRSQVFTGGWNSVTKHGFARRGHIHPLYITWQDMHRRCYDARRPTHHYYADKGIEVCEAWTTCLGFAADMAPSWRPGLTLERRDNKLGYSPENCYWATRAQQSRNRDYNRYLELGAARLLITDWAMLLGIELTTLAARIDRLGWSIERALTTPLQSQGRH